MTFESDDYKLRYKWVPELHPEGDGLLITEFLNGAVQEVMHARDEALKTAFVAYLRMNGYTVIEPEEGEK